MNSLLLFIAVLPAVFADSHLPFSISLRENAYTLSWNFNLEEETVVFEVNASTTGWVGLGLSPNGGMENSDIAIGWVDDSGNAFLYDTIAPGQTRPIIDSQQDWDLISGEEGDGYTVLRFSRNFVTCDDQDRDIVAQTQFIIYSWSEIDPPENDPMQTSYHGRDNRGSASVNLLGGLPNPPPEPEDSQSFFVGVENVEIPNDSDTTYWCLSMELPDEVLAGTHYIYKYSPEIQENNTAYVHHMVVSQCAGVLNVTAGTNGVCPRDVASVTNPLTECLSSQLLAVWAVGGTDFLYPNDVAYRVSGPGKEGFVFIEIHYDNPELTSGVIDNSGIRFFYTAREPENEAGQLTIGASTDQSVIIPPQAENFTVLARCSVDCSTENIPETGIKIFANFFHTHLAGHGLVLEHYRINPDCGVLEELQPIDINLQYDFDYQQTTILPQEVTILPGDLLILKCFYRTADRDFVTVGGEGTRDEMCFAFPLFYPLTTAFTCGSTPAQTAYNSFIDDHVTEELQEDVRDVVKRLYAFDETRSTREEIKETFNQIDWTSERIEAFENALLTNLTLSFCFGTSFGFNFDSGIPETPCPYQAPDVCTGETPVTCCDRLAGDGALKFVVNVLLVLSMVGLTTLFI